MALLKNIIPKVNRLQQWNRININLAHTNAEASISEKFKFETLSVSNPEKYVYHVELNRPKQLNTMNKAFWREIKECFNKLGEDEECRSIVLTGAGKVFTAGLDFYDMAELAGLVTSTDDLARKAKVLRQLIVSYQQSFTAIEKCPKPVIVAIHDACIGGGIDMICACDIRYCTSDAWFQVKEVDIGMAADVGTLQRLPKVVGNDSLVRELAYTVRKMYSDEAYHCGLVSKVFQSKDEMVKMALAAAATIASKSPVAVQGTKISLNYSRDHSVDEGLHHVAQWNMFMLQSEDLMKAAMAAAEKSKVLPTFAKL